MALTKQERNSLPSEDFAVPGKRKLPIHDAAHTLLAWGQIDRTQGLSETERDEARAAVLDRAKAFGVDTTKWDKTPKLVVSNTESTFTMLSAMSLDMPADEEHPNRMPFKGILTRLDRPSDLPVGGANGRKTFLPRSVAEKLLPSLLGMPIDFTPKFDGHDVKRKIGTLTAAHIEDDDVDGDGIAIEGFFFAADFPQECARIQAEKEDLGFSYEIRAQTRLVGDLLQIVGGKFTGAAMLYKDKAAYSTTSLAAQADQELDMTKEELQSVLDAAVKPITDKIGALSTDVEGLKANGTELKANAEMRAKVATHANKLRETAAALEAAGIGLDGNRGHVRVLHHMAASMEAEAAGGKLPHAYNEFDLRHSGERTAPADNTKAIADAVALAVKPLQDKLEASGTMIEDLKKKGFDNAAEPAKKTISKDSLQLLAKGGITAAPTTPMNEAEVDKMLEAAGVTGMAARIAAKLQLTRDGVMRSH